MTPNLLDELEGVVLEPCPFCGCTDHETSPWPTDRNRDWWKCNCGNPDCGVEVGAQTPEEAVAKWNRRTHAPALADMAKRMEAAERDARRYRWLREQNATIDNPDAWTITRCDFTDEEGPARYWVGSDLDAAIDATQEGEG